MLLLLNVTRKKCACSLETGYYFLFDWWLRKSGVYNDIVAVYSGEISRECTYHCHIALITTYRTPSYGTFRV